MRAADGKIDFGPWAPDQGELGNPGLIEARNVVYSDAAYRPWPSLSGSGDALASRPLGAIETQNSGGTSYLYAGLATSIQRQNVALGTWTNVSSGVYTSSTSWEFARFDELIIATNYFNFPEYQTIGTGSFVGLSTSGAAPKARRIGKIGRFIFLGDTNEAVNGVVPYRVQWCAIDDPNNWPTPGTSAALIVQSGEQFLNSEWGPVQAIRGGDQFGLIFQRGGVTRVTYIGGDEVFQFDELEATKGVYFPRSVVTAGALTYYISDAGVQVTDGVSSSSLGEGIIDRYLWSQYLGDYPERVFGGVDSHQKIIAWCIPTASPGAGQPGQIFLYNYEAKRFTHADQVCELLYTSPSAYLSAFNTVKAFTSTNVLGDFTGTPGTATLTTGEIEPNLGIKTFIQGVKPLVTRAESGTNPTPLTTTVALGLRDDQQAAVTFTSESTPTPRTGFCDFRSEARYVRARLTITQSFSRRFGRALGLEHQNIPGSAV